MTIPIHRDTDPRVCGAITVVSNQNTVYANGLLVAVDGDPNSHGAGGLIATCNNVYVNGIIVCNHSADSAAPDVLCFIIGAPHCNPATAGGSSNVFVGD
jgi:hypothetical protein|tara:strand:+ start:108 stop:404 length:297 start_codon:yes stop_codon:yes gene_type:complete